MATATINISVPDQMKREVEEVIATEGYGNTSELFRDLFRKYQTERQERKLETLLLEAVETGDYTPLVKADFEKIKERGLARIKNRIKK